jgi:hypothetical protein
VFEPPTLAGALVELGVALGPVVVPVVPLVVVLGTCEGSAGTVLPRPGVVLPRLGTVLPRFGNCPGKAGTAGTVGVAVVVPPVNPGAVEGVAGGVTTVLLPAAGGARGGGAPSGSTQLTSRFEQKSGIVVRSLDASAADANGVVVTAVRAAASATSIDFRVFMVFLPRRTVTQSRFSAIIRSLVSVV